MKIVYWSDYACPYCYIGETRLKKAIKELELENEVEIETRAFELDPDAPKTVETITVDRFAMKYRLERGSPTADRPHLAAWHRRRYRLPLCHDALHQHPRCPPSYEIGTDEARCSVGRPRE